MFIYLGMTPKDQNCMHEEIRSRLYSGNSCYHLAKNNFCTHLQSNNMKIKIYINIILSAALHGCKTWSLTPRKGYRQRIFDNRQKVTGYWRRLQNEQLKYLCCSFDVIHMTKTRRMSLLEHVAHMEEKRSAYRCLVGVLEKRGLLETPTHRCYNILQPSYLLRNSQVFNLCFSFMHKGMN